MVDIVVIGSMNMDLVVKTARLPKPGETIEGDDLKLIPGGKGGNQAIAAAKLGMDVLMVGHVGNDSFGRKLIEELSNQNVNIENVTIEPNTATGTAVILVDEFGENSIVISAGSNGRVCKEDINKIENEIRSAKVVLLQYEIPVEVIQHTINIVDKENALMIVNPAPAKQISKDLISKIDILIPNETEAALLTGIEITDINSAKKAGKKLLALGIEIVIITLGELGALLLTNDLVKHIPAQKVKAIDTTAAGDAFVGGLATAIAKHFPLPSAVAYGCCAGTLATTKLGAQTSLPGKKEVDDLYELYSHELRQD